MHGIECCGDNAGYQKVSKRSSWGNRGERWWDAGSECAEKQRNLDDLPAVVLKRFLTNWLKNREAVVREFSHTRFQLRQHKITFPMRREKRQEFIQFLLNWFFKAFAFALCKNSNVLKYTWHTLLPFLLCYCLGVALSYWKTLTDLGILLLYQ